MLHAIITHETTALSYGYSICNVKMSLLLKFFYTNHLSLLQHNIAVVTDHVSSAVSLCLSVRVFRPFVSTLIFERVTFGSRHVIGHDS